MTHTVFRLTDWGARRTACRAAPVLPARPGCQPGWRSTSKPGEWDLVSELLIVNLCLSEPDGHLRAWEALARAQQPDGCSPPGPDRYPPMSPRHFAIITIRRWSPRWPACWRCPIELGAPGRPVDCSADPPPASRGGWTQACARSPPCSRAPAAVLAAVVGADGLSSATATHPGPDTVFELGSMTKTFTALLLAEMVTRGEVTTTTRSPPTYPPTRTLPRTDTPVTLVQLATHTAGFPRLPTNLYRRALHVWATNPYARYHLDDLYRATARTRPRSRPRTHAHYSNFGVGLLGQLLANAVQ